MNPSTLEIHEFSTGIRPERTPDGGWVSRGFTGQYMNRTIDPIPSVVERSIANREFAVTEGASSDRPAIIGRVVGSGENAWSVLAVVTRGRDEKGRSASVYRYFLCEGENNLWKILAWMGEGRGIPWMGEGRGIPTFNPFDIKVVGQPNLYMASSQRPANLSPTVQALPLNTSNPILLPPGGQDDVHSINILAIRQANTNHQPVSWAFNVEALEQPRRFQVIQAASDRAYQILQKAIANAPQVLTPVVADEEALKSAIRSLMNSSQVKPEAVQAIAQALGNEQIPSEYWHTLFDGQGAKTAISQKIYSPQMVRLVTLRVMVIPETLPEFLGWLNIQGGKNKPDDNQTVSLRFQSDLRRHLFPQEQLTDGIKFILPKLLKEQITPEAVSWLLKESQSAWAHCRHQLLDDIHADLEFIGSHFTSSQWQSKLPLDSLRCGDEIWQNLISYWQVIIARNSSSLQPFYKPLAELFYQLDEYRLSAYFYQVSDDLVSKAIFTKAFPNTRGDFQMFHSLYLQREITLFERIIAVLAKEFIVPIQIVVPLSLIIFASGLVAGKLLWGQSTESAQTANIQESSEISEDREAVGFDQPRSVITEDQIARYGATTAPDITSLDNNIPEEKKLTANNNFEQTRTTIEQIIEEIRQKKPDIKRNKVIIEIKSILQVPDLNYAAAEKKAGTERDRLIEAIYNYQKTLQSQNNKGSGFMEPGQGTANDLKKQLETKLNIP